MVSRSQVVSIARSYIGTPFVHQGRLKGVGIDCLGLIICVLREASIFPKWVDFTRYSKWGNPALMHKAFSLLFDRIEPVCAKPADILCFSSIGGRPIHLGFASDIGVIHAYYEARKVVETRLDSVLSRNLFCVYNLETFKGVEGLWELLGS